MRNLPCIIEIAENHGLELNPKTLAHTEVMAKCPFCGGDANKPGKYKLSLNQEKRVFKCWICKESGGVLQFEAKLTGKSFAEIKQKYYGNRKTPYHPAEMLSPQQLEAIEWQKAKRESYNHFRQNVSRVYEDWHTHCIRHKRLALAKLIIADTVGNVNEVIKNIEHEEDTSFVPDLTSIVFDAFSEAQWTETWMIESLELAVSALRTSFVDDEEDGKNALVYLIFLERDMNLSSEKTKTIDPTVESTMEPSKTKLEMA
ncbi:hypothetical protein [Salibacterium aidingense]|uniref:hypothetical protein n=1 Tax=Salibacterium aidingense TaxID=384933 RepID=UPI0003F84F7A|nr:hypothetical protein [Salibacterium aidingense]